MSSIFLGAWIITAGTSSGVVKIVGEAAHEHILAHGVKKKNVVLGVAAWGLLQHTDQLINPDVRLLAICGIENKVDINYFYCIMNCFI